MITAQFKTALFGVAACFLHSLPTAAAVSYDRYFMFAQGASSPFPVKAAGSSFIEYLNPHLPFSPPGGDGEVVLSSAPSVAGRSVGRFSYSIDWPAVTDITWMPFRVSEHVSHDPFALVYLHTVIGVDQNGDVKLKADAKKHCDYPLLCYSTNKTFSATLTRLKRISTSDGNQIEILPMVIRIDGLPWATYYFGYDVGLVAAETFNDQFNVQSFSPVSLPPPKADGVVVEYVNTADFPNAPGGHYFYSADSAEQAQLDAGVAGRFARTGRSFASGGFVPVCRFYGSMSPGPNSHFFTVSDSECDALKSMQISPIPTDSPQWNYEGTGMYGVAPVRSAQGRLQCMSGTVPVYRAYNNAFPQGGGKNPWDSNHRFSTQSADMDEMVAKGWLAEGIALCAPLPAQ